MRVRDVRVTRALRRILTAGACAGAALAGTTASCNALLGNSDHDVAEASAEASPHDVAPEEKPKPDRTAPKDRETDTRDANVDSGIHPQQSCAVPGPGRTNCGPSAESCCMSPTVMGGKFLRSYDAVTFTDAAAPATVATLYIDKYEITVGRFRAFVAAAVAGWRPLPGAGKHGHVNGGKGLTTKGGAFETGWDPTWPPLPGTQNDWTMSLTCDPKYATWTPTDGANENMPINCITWYQAYAFCIWDGGFLPSEAEWNYAAAGGGGLLGQRVFPWSSPATSQTADCSYANFLGSGSEGGAPCTTTGANAVGSESPMGDGFYGQTDLAGNVLEWTLDFGDKNYFTPCDNCAELTGALREVRGGDYFDISTNVTASQRRDESPPYNDPTWGARCARSL